MGNNSHERAGKAHHCPQCTTRQMGLRATFPLELRAFSLRFTRFDHGTFRDAYKGKVNKEELDNTATWAKYVGWNSEVNHCVVKRFRSGLVMCVTEWEADMRPLTKAAELAETFKRDLKPDIGIAFATDFICELKSIGITWQHTHGPLGAASWNEANFRIWHRRRTNSCRAISVWSFREGQQQQWVVRHISYILQP